jgi:hypothetical protein
MKKFWQSKKITALVLTLAISIACVVLNQTKGFNIDPSVILSVLGLSAVYILRQGSIDSKKTDKNAFKPFWESRKYIANVIGILLPLIIGFLNQKYNLKIPTEAVLGFLGLNAVYILRQGSLDVKEPDKH